MHGEAGEDVGRCGEVWCGEEARERGVVYLEEGVRGFGLGNGARFVVSGTYLCCCCWQGEDVDDVLFGYVFCVFGESFARLSLCFQKYLFVSSFIAR